MKTLKVLITTTLLSASLAGPTLQAQDYENSGNISVGGVGYFSDSVRNVDDAVGLYLGGELPLANRWSLAGDIYVVDSEVQGSGPDANLEYGRLGLNYHLNQLNGWQPYVGFGLGNMDVDQPGSLNDRDEGTFDIGFGMKRRFNDNWMLKGDYKVIKGSDTHGWDDAVTLGVAYAFGRAPSRPVASTPAARTGQPSTVLDSDNDGIPDNRDACSNTPAGVRVDSRGCEIDTDGDGVVDSRDNCADTPATLVVDRNGCPELEITQRRQELLVNFEFDRSEVRPQYDNEITEFADFMKTYGNTNVVIEGHTDSVGSEQYNQGLSERRANAVREELVNENGIEAERVSTVGYGEARPVAPNTTDAGRAQNRRIEAVISVEIEEQRRR